MNETIQKAFDLTKQVLGDARREGKRVACSVSGGADSDILIDLCERTVPHFVNYVFFDTGIEYQATKDHLKYLEEKYGIEIHREKAKVPVPLGNKKYGMPFLSKNVSSMISRLQKHGFQWENDTYENLCEKYPKCTAALKWWTNKWISENGTNLFSIDRNSWLKEFIIKNPPQFPISDKCCLGAKKNTAGNYIKNNKVDLMIMGIRKSEGGQRASVYKEQLFYNKHYKTMYFLPILYFSDADRCEYEELYNVVHSKCYTEYGLDRTGCAGCPFGREYQCEKDVIKQYEPRLSKAIENMWADVYDYTDKYHEFQRLMNLKYKRKKRCSCGCTEFDPDTVAMNLKIFGREGKIFLCKECFKKNFEWTEEDWNNEIEKFKMQGCDLF